jgi:DNA repair exonuclease SbcCD ATPase subunit
MKIRRLRIENWRGVSASEIEFGGAVTIVAGPNEVGKSSLFEALRFLFRFPDNSAHRDIEAVRPVHVDQAPAVELEADLGEVSIRYAKRFKKAGRAGETTLRVEAPGRNPESLTGREAHDRAEALLAGDIDVDLWEALQVEQGTGISQASLKEKRGLQEALDAAAGTRNALSPDHAGLVERVEAEYRRYFTATGKPRDAFDALPKKIAVAEESCSELQQRLAAMQAVADRHAQAKRDLEAKEAGLPSIKGQVAAFRRRLEQVQAIETTHAKAELEVKELEAGLGTDERAAEQRSQWRDEIRQRSAAVGADQERLGESRVQRASLEAELAALQRQQTQQRDALAATAAERRLCSLAIDDAGYRREHARLSSVLERVDDLERRRLELQATIDGIALEPADIEALRRLERTVVEAEATARAVAPSLRLTALTGLDLEVRGKPVRLEPGQVRADSVTSGYSVKVPGVLELAIATTANIDQSQAAADAARQALSQALEQRLVTSLVQAEARLAEKQAAVAQSGEIEAQRMSWLQGETPSGLRARASELAARRAAIKAELSASELHGNEAAARALLPELDARLQDAQAALDRAVDAEAVLRSRLSALDVDLARLTERVGNNLEGVQLLQAKLDAARGELCDEDLAARLAAGSASLGAARGRLDQASEALQAANPESVKLLAGNAEAALDRHRREIAQARVEIGQLDGQLAQARHAGLFDRLSAAETELEALRDEFRRVERRALAARRLWEVLDSHRAAASQRYVRPLKERIDSLGRLVFNPSFAVDVGADLSIESRSLDGVTVPFDSLSGGAREQLGILARLAAAQIVGAHSEVPVLMDDTLGFTDDERLTRMGAAIATVARNNQVVILTCMPSRFSYIGNAKTVTL